MRIAVEIGVLLPVVGSTRLWSSGLRAARLNSAGTLAWVLGIVPAAGVLLAGARAALILATAGIAIGTLPAGILPSAGILAPRMGFSGILAAGVGHSGERPARVWSARISPARVDAALSAYGIAAVGRHPGGDIDGPVPLLRLRRRRGRHN